MFFIFFSRGKNAILKFSFYFINISETIYCFYAIVFLYQYKSLRKRERGSNLTPVTLAFILCTAACVILTISTQMQIYQSLLVLCVPGSGACSLSLEWAQSRAPGGA